MGHEKAHGQSEKSSIDESFGGRRGTIVAMENGGAVNASGHKDQLKRQYGLLSICGLALTTNSAWIVLGGSVTIAIANGGPPGVIYEVIVGCIYYGIIAACIAELSSSIPSSGGVYHWASVTPGAKYGRALGFFTGWINFFGWLFDYAAITQIVASVCVQLYAVFHPDFTIDAWHTYIAYLLVTWVITVFIIFGNRVLPYLQNAGLALLLGGGLITIIVLAAKPKKHASTAFVFKDWENITGWSSGVAFLTGVLNGAFVIGTPDSITHLAEELPNPSKDIPKGIAVQIVTGLVSSILFAIALFYAVTDLDAVVKSNGAFPVAAIYRQATGSSGGTFGLLFIIFLSLLCCLVGTLLTCGRIWWALARDEATPFPKLFSSVNESLSCPIPATLFCSVISTGLGAIPLGSPTAFTALAGSFIILTSTSYAMAIAPNLFTGRKNTPPGPFWMGKAGFFVNGLAIVLIVFFNIMFCFPYGIPTSTQSMNYNSVILVGVTVLTAIWWFAHGVRNYAGPKMSHMILEGVAHG